MVLDPAPLWANGPGGLPHARIQDYAGVDHGSFVTPNHEWPAHLLLTLTAVEADGLRTSKTVRLDPREADVTVNSNPQGMRVSLGSETQRTRSRTRCSPSRG